MEKDKQRNSKKPDQFAIIISAIALLISAVSTYNQFYHKEKSLIIYVVPKILDGGIMMVVNLINAGSGSDIFLESIQIEKDFVLGGKNDSSNLIVPAKYLDDDQNRTYSVEVPLNFEITNGAYVGYANIENICGFVDSVFRGKTKELHSHFLDFYNSPSISDSLISVDTIVTYRVLDDLYVKKIRVMGSNITRIFENSVEGVIQITNAVDLFNVNNPEGIVLYEEGEKPTPDEVFKKMREKVDQPSLIPRYLVRYTIDSQSIRFDDWSALFPMLYKQNKFKDFYDPDIRKKLIDAKENCER